MLQALPPKNDQMQLFLSMERKKINLRQSFHVAGFILSAGNHCTFIIINSPGQISISSMLQKKSHHVDPGGIVNGSTSFSVYRINISTMEDELLSTLIVTISGS